MGLEQHAKRELERAGYFDPQSMYAGMLGENVMELVKVFIKQGHSGMSASIALALFKQVASFLPLSPLTGEDSEWQEISPGLFQNLRCSHVFKEQDGTYDAEGKIFEEPDGSCYTGFGSRVPITFPYQPHTEIVKV